MKRNGLTDFWDWWRQELLALVPSKAAERRVPVAVGVYRDHCIIYRERNSSRETLEGVNPDNLGRRIVELTGAKSCDILLAPDRYLKRPLSENRLPHARARTMAAIDVTDSTPLPIDSVHIGFVQANEPGHGTDYHVIRKDVLDPVLVSLATAGVRPSTISLMTDDCERKLSDASLAEIDPVFSKTSWRRRVLAGAVGLLVVGLCLTYAHAYRRYSAAAEQLAAQIEAKQAQAMEVRKALDARQNQIALLESARKRKAQSVPVVRIWEELTRTIPDASWIMDLQLKNDEVTITGFSPSAADLIQSLEASALFQDTNFDAPVTKVPGQDGERFVIRTAIER